MNTIQKHLQRWEHNRSFIGRVDPAYPEWAVTVAFYAMLHLVQAYLMREGYCPDKHKIRSDALKRIAKDKRGKDRDRIRTLIDYYKTLREASNHARYDPELTRFGSAEAVNDEIMSGLVVKIEDMVRNLMGGNSAVPKLGQIELRQ
ncbi:HEPN domain-containing protein [Mucisphaera calidilacus]|uniref:Uncharacterized protein n=1 Tax=Mucisphaera calidilacus TaxID=2527982 RepID=A0A518C0K1_9BACT|nr:HEPN domain-containing protein [Mucisphaera calidilacus]QDU72737.1 hypothetical protein Pan265_26110 [Mucisphaera calidilacus]